MEKKIQDVMTKTVASVGRTATLREIAHSMKQHEIGDVLVIDEQGKLYGIVTDRDVVVRGLAEGGDPDVMNAADVCTRDALVSLGPDATVDDAVQLMADHAIRRLPVVLNGRVVGIVSIGDLAQLGESRQALAEISDAPANA